MQKNINVILGGAMQEFVSSRISEGYYSNISEYVRDLIRRDKERLDNAEQAKHNIVFWEEVEKGLKSPVSTTLTMDNFSDRMRAVIEGK